VAFCSVAPRKLTPHRATKPWRAVTPVLKR
jgi:hypothetical protein